MFETHGCSLQQAAACLAHLFGANWRQHVSHSYENNNIKLLSEVKFITLCLCEKYAVVEIRAHRVTGLELGKISFRLMFFPVCFRPFSPEFQVALISKVSLKFVAMYGTPFNMKLVC